MTIGPNWKGLAAGAVVALFAATMAESQQPGRFPGSGPAAATFPPNSPGVFSQNASASDSPEAAVAGTAGGPVVGAIESVVDHGDALSHPAAAGRDSADPHHRVGAAGNFIGFSHADGSGTQKITVLHASKSWMAVYHIDRSGTIRLVSSRPIDADFSLQLNATSPLPEEIRQMERQTRSGGDR